MVEKLIPIPMDMSVDRRHINAVISRVNEVIDNLAPPPPPALSPDMPQAFIRGLGTVRPCRVCGALVAGGPTACTRCVDDFDLAVAVDDILAGRDLGEGTCREPWQTQRLRLVALMGERRRLLSDNESLRHDLQEIAKGLGVGHPDREEAKKRIIAVGAERDRLRTVLVEVRSAVGLEPRPAADAETLGERIDKALEMGT